MTVHTLGRNQIQPHHFAQVTTAPAGGWSWFGDPRAVAYNGTTYFGYVNTNGDICVRSITDTTGRLTAETVLHAALEADDHDDPSLLIRNSDHRILVFYTKHSGAAMYLRISTNSEDISSFGAEINLDSQLGGVAYTYPNPVQLTAETNEPLYLFYRDPIDANTTAMRYSKSTDGGATWSAQTLLYSVTGRSAYWKVATNSTDRIDFGVSDGHPFYNPAVSIGHFYYQGGAFKKTDGTTVTVPLAWANVTQIHDGTVSTSWIWDVSFDPVTTKPAVTFMTFPATNDHRLYWAAWSGTAWGEHQVAVGGQTFLGLAQSGGSGYYYGGGITLDRANATTVYCSREVDGNYELFIYKTTDAGSTWTPTQLTAKSPGVNFRPVGVRGYTNGYRALWLCGQYTDYFTWSLGVRGVYT